MSEQKRKTRGGVGQWANYSYLNVSVNKTQEQNYARYLVCVSLRMKHRRHGVLKKKTLTSTYFVIRC